MRDEEFEQALDHLSDPEYGQVTDAEFFGALLAMDETDEIKLTAVFTLVNQPSHPDEIVK